jgi:hypothetical protein
MRANIIACLLAVAFFACLTVLDTRTRVSLRVNLLRENNRSEDDGNTEGPDAYKVAVLVSVGATILSLFS